MIRVEPRPKPDRFVEEVEQAGASWLANNATGRPHPYWRAFREQLADAFGSLCAYGAMFEPVGTVDHFISVDEDRSKAYDWSNYRFAAGWLNSSKQSLKSAEIIDPFVVDNSWFEIHLPSLQLVVATTVPPEWRARAELMLTRLHLGHDERILRQRREWYRMYQEGELTLVGLKKKAPLIAAAIEKQQKVA